MCSIATTTTIYPSVLATTQQPELSMVLEFSNLISLFHLGLFRSWPLAIILQPQ